MLHNSVRFVTFSSPAFVQGTIKILKYDFIPLLIVIYDY
jgi:hypothetical protein